MRAGVQAALRIRSLARGRSGALLGFASSRRIGIKGRRPSRAQPPAVLRRLTTLDPMTTTVFHTSFAILRPFAQVFPSRVGRGEDRLFALARCPMSLLARLLRGCLPIALVPFLLGGCPTSGFECGTPLASDPDQTYTCSRPEEVCVCATRSCARIDHPASDAKDPCPSGLRYVDEVAFVTDDDMVGQCVDEAHASSKIEQPDVQSRCSGSPPLIESSSGQDAETQGASSSGGTAGAMSSDESSTSNTEPEPAGSSSSAGSSETSGTN